MITREVQKEWPEDKPTPWFARNSTDSSKLVAFVDCLASDDRFTYEKCGLGRNAIKDIILSHMRERRRSQKLDKIYESPASAESTASADDSSSNSGTPPPSLFDKKRKEYLAYFDPGKSCDNHITLVRLQ